MRDSDKLPALAVVWAAVAAVLIFVGPATDMIALTLFLGVAAVFSTLAIVGVFQDNAGKQSEAASAAKAKRSGRVSRLVEDLDDDEVYQLEELLLSRREDRIRDE